MKRIFCIIFLLFAILFAGCTTTATTYPSLKGNWTGPMKGYIEGSGYKEYPAGLLTMVVTEQKDRFFSGILIEPVGNKTVDVEEFSGVIHLDKKTFTMVEYNGGYNYGTIVSNNEIELIYMNDKKPALLFIDSFQRIP
jgi:hypothetical protein